MHLAISIIFAVINGLYVAYGLRQGWRALPFLNAAACLSNVALIAFLLG